MHSLRKDGSFWILSDAGASTYLSETKGLFYIAELMRHPSREIHALDLVAAAAGSEVTDHAADGRTMPASERRPGSGFVDRVLDERAHRAYRRRCADLSLELERAESQGNPEDTIALREELEALQRELARATGLGNRRRTTSDSERARLSVTRTIRSALTRIAESSPAAAGKLARRIRTGTFCSYSRAASEP